MSKSRSLVLENVTLFGEKKKVIADVINYNDAMLEKGGHLIKHDWCHKKENLGTDTQHRKNTN